MNVDSINNPENKLNKYINDSLKILNYSFADPFIKVYLNVKVTFHDFITNIPFSSLNLINGVK